MPVKEASSHAFTLKQHVGKTTTMAYTGLQAIPHPTCWHDSPFLQGLSLLFLVLQTDRQTDRPLRERDQFAERLSV